MSTAAVVAVIVAVVVIVALVAVVMPRSRAKTRERQVAGQRDEVVGAHRDQAQDRIAQAEFAEQEAARERAEADLHEARAKLHERGLADDELPAERDRLSIDEPSSGRFVREQGETVHEERDETVAPEDRPPR